MHLESWIDYIFPNNLSSLPLNDPSNSCSSSISILHAGDKIGIDLVRDGVLRFENAASDFFCATERGRADSNTYRPRAVRPAQYTLRFFEDFRRMRLVAAPAEHL